MLNYINQEEWAELWAKSLKVDYVPMVDIRFKGIRKSKKVLGFVKDFVLRGLTCGVTNKIYNVLKISFYYKLEVLILR